MKNETSITTAAVQISMANIIVRMAALRGKK